MTSGLHPDRHTHTHTHTHTQREREGGRYSHTKTQVYTHTHTHTHTSLTGQRCSPAVRHKLASAVYLAYKLVFVHNKQMDYSF